jgi:hypothetical protein
MMKDLFQSRYLITFLAGIVFAFGMLLELVQHPTTSAAAATQSEIEIHHKAPLGQELPAPAQMMTIGVELKNTKSTELKVRLIASRDGKLLDVAFPPGFLNEIDNPLYQLKIPAPSAFLSYQFVVHESDGSLSTSQRFVVQRACVPKLAVDVPSDIPDAVFRKEVSDLLVKAKQRERDTQNYDTALALLTDLKSLAKE